MDKCTNIYLFKYEVLEAVNPNSAVQADDPGGLMAQVKPEGRLLENIPSLFGCL